MSDRDPLYLFLCHLEWRNRHNLAAYNELVAALDDGEPAIRELAQDLIHRQSRRQHAAKPLLRVTRKMIGVDVNSQPTLVASVKTGNPQPAYASRTLWGQRTRQIRKGEGAAFHRVGTRPGSTSSYRESAC